jgi:hypothetical protein
LWSVTKAKRALGDLCARGDELSLLIDQSPGASFNSNDFKKAELSRWRCGSRHGSAFVCLTI